MFLGIRFEGQVIFPAGKVVKRFREKVNEALQTNSGDSLFNPLQGLTNLINGWGKCYKNMRVLNEYQKLDEYIKSSVETVVS